MKLNKMTLFAALIALLIVPSMLLAKQSKMQQLRERFKERYPQVQALKQAGTIGETDEGYLAFVKEKDSKAEKIVDAENADRKALYAQIAQQENTTPELVAVRNAKRNFEKAQPGEYLRENGKWKKKEEPSNG